MIQIPLTREQFDAKARQLQQQGIAIAGDEGKLSKSGVTAGYLYQDGILTITILEKPFFISTDYCEEQIQNALGLNA